jgi:hypothetical protein
MKRLASLFERLPIVVFASIGVLSAPVRAGTDTVAKPGGVTA